MCQRELIYCLKYQIFTQRSFGLQEEQNECPFSKLIEVVSTLRTFGNRFFKQSRYEKAKEHYKQVKVTF